MSLRYTTATLAIITLALLRKADSYHQGMNRLYRTEMCHYSHAGA
jgi:hypothetical protein